MASIPNDLKVPNKIKVSNEFVEIYKNFNVTSQIEKINKLSEKEIYLLLILCLDKHIPENELDPIDPVVSNNFSHYSDRIKEIYKVQDDEKSSIRDLNDLINETGSDHISVDLLVDLNNNNLPDPLNKGEVRGIKIDNIID